MYMYIYRCMCVNRRILQIDGRKGEFLGLTRIYR